MTISTIALSNTGVFGGEGGAGGSPPQDKEVLKKMIKQSRKHAQKTCRKGR